MIVLTMRTDRPQAELGLYSDGKEIAYDIWEAHRELSVTIHERILTLLELNNIQLKNLEGIVCFKGPGSFTGLRIGLTVANALAFSLSKPVVSASGADWITKGLSRLNKGDDEMIAMPEYGAEAHITQQLK